MASALGASGSYASKEPASAGYVGGEMTTTEKDMYTAPMPLPPGEYAPPRDEMAESTAIVVGTDLVQVSEVGKAMERFGERYLRRLFTEAELSYCMEST